MKKKINLRKLKVTSFSTDMDSESQKKAKGGFSATCFCWMITNGNVNLDCWVTDTNDGNGCNVQ